MAAAPRGTLGAMSSPSQAASPDTPSSATIRLAAQPASRAPLGIGMVLLAAVLWGTTGTAQSLAPSGLAPVWVGALRLLIAGAFFAALLRWQGGARGLGALPWRGVLAGGVCVAAYNLSFFAGVKASGVALGTAIAIGSGPIWAGLLQTVVQRRWPAAVWWAGTLLGVAGGAAMALDGRTSVQAPPGGIALCLVAGLSYAAYALVNQRLVARAALGGRQPGGVRLGRAVVPAGRLRHRRAARGVGARLGVVLYLGLVATGVAYLLFTHALRHISGATGVTLALAEPVVAFCLAVAVVGNRRPPWPFGGWRA